MPVDVNDLLLSAAYCSSSASDIIEDRVIG